MKSSLRAESLITAASHMQSRSAMKAEAKLLRSQQLGGQVTSA